MENLWQPSSNASPTEFVDIFAEQRAQQSNKIVKHLKRSSPKSRKKTVLNRDLGHTEGRKRNWTKAFQFYQKCLCYAPANSRYIGTAYAYRAAIFSKLGLFARELIDLDMADKSPCPAWLTVEELEINRRICVGKLKLDCEPIRSTIQLDYKPHAFNPNMAEVVKITQNEQFGRHIIADVDIPVGQAISVEPFFAFSSTNEPHFQCQTCLKQQQNFIACKDCTDVVFCNEQCEQSNRTHRLVCGTGFYRLAQDIKLAIETVLLAVIEFDHAEALKAFVMEVHNGADTVPLNLIDFRAKYRSYLTFHKTKCPKVIDAAYKAHQMMLQIPIIQVYFDTNEKQQFLSHLLCQHMAINALNGFELDGSTMVCVSTSFFNHSCAPNVITRIVDNRIICRTIRPIRCGDQLFINYLDDLNWTPNKRDSIARIWDFQCKCEACEPIDREDAAVMKLMGDGRFAKICDLVMSCGLKMEQRDHWMQLCKGVLTDYGHLQWIQQLGIVVKLYLDCWNLV